MHSNGPSRYPNDLDAEGIHPEDTAAVWSANEAGTSDIDALGAARSSTVVQKWKLRNGSLEGYIDHALMPLKQQIADVKLVR
jgi:hypothetical protein